MFDQLPLFNRMNFPIAAKFTFALISFCVVVLATPIQFSKGLTTTSVSATESLDPIKVRESTTELHIQVGERLFVFGKSKGTLEKVKIGMHVLTFAQVAGTEGLESGFKAVTWKKLKDGSIQIQSSYSPWPATLTWTVLASGRLKMEARGTFDFQASSTLGLGFDLPNYELKNLNWSAKGLGTGTWMDHQTENEPSKPFFLQGIEKVNLAFESVALSISSDTPNLILKVADLKNHQSGLLQSDLSFLFQAPSQGNSSTEIETPSGDSNNNLYKPLELSAMILWFDFH